MLIVYKAIGDIFHQFSSRGNRHTTFVCTLANFFKQKTILPRGLSILQKQKRYISLKKTQYQALEAIYMNSRCNQTYQTLY